MTVLAAVVALLAAGSLHTEVAVRGDLRAELSYDRRPDFTYVGTHVRIERRGRLVVSQPLRSCGGAGCWLWPGEPGGKSIGIRDLDADGRAEVVVRLYTGGAHCCLLVYVYRGGTFRLAHLDSGGAVVDERDLDGDGRREFVSGDPRFDYLFTSHADSYLPVRVTEYRGGRFAIATRRYPSVVRADERTAWRLYLRERTRRDVRGVLAAWAADKYLLGEGAEVWGTLRREGVGSAFVAELRRKLRELGYAR